MCEHAINLLQQVGVAQLLEARAQGIPPAVLACTAIATLQAHLLVACTAIAALQAHLLVACTAHCITCGTPTT